MQAKKSRDKRATSRVKRKQKQVGSLPVIPDRRYFTISEVGHLCAVKAYVLRYWEQEFPQLKPVKRRGNRRYYQQADVLLVRQIKKLLYEDGFTIEGARTQLSNASNPATTPTTIATLKPEGIHHPTQLNVTVKKVIAELKSVLKNLQADVIQH